MKIQILELIEGAKQAEGLTVIIDVFRAFTTECYCFDGGAVKCYPIGSMEEAFALKNAHPDWVLLGERKGAKVAGCDLGNSPWDAMNYDFRGKTMIHSTSAGTQGIVNAANANASEIVTGSLVNARAVCDYIRVRDPETVSLVAMGKAGVSSTPEDLLAARYMRWLLEQDVSFDGGRKSRECDDAGGYGVIRGCDDARGYDHIRGCGDARGHGDIRGCGDVGGGYRDIAADSVGEIRKECIAEDGYRDIAADSTGETGKECTAEDLSGKDRLTKGKFEKDRITKSISEAGFDLNAEIAYLKDHGGEQFFDPALAHIFPREDYPLCVAADRFNFVLRVEQEGERLVIRQAAIDSIKAPI